MPEGPICAAPQSLGSVVAADVAGTDVPATRLAAGGWYNFAIGFFNVGAGGGATVVPVYVNPLDGVQYVDTSQAVTLLAGDKEAREFKYWPGRRMGFRVTALAAASITITIQFGVSSK